VHEEVQGFAKVAEAYERARPEYPLGIVDRLVAAAAVEPGDVIVDLAAGTGKLTRLLVGRGARVIAVEPVANMREQLTARLPEVEAIEGTAEATGLPGGIARLLTAAQAFHWFANHEALSEIARVLRPDGYLALIWNGRDLTQPLQVEISRIVAPYRGDTPTHENGSWRSLMDETPLFKAVLEVAADFEQVLTPDGLADRVGSTSFIANLPEPELSKVRAQARALVPDGESSVAVRYECEAFLFRRR
jgi:ubiquinone/menaquinone biosynthesis C-methylase UbiE